MRHDRAIREPRGLDRKRTILLLRSVVVVSLCYLVLFTEAGNTPQSVAYVLWLIATNAALGLVPGRVYADRRFAKALCVFDTASVLVGLYLTVGLSQDFLVVYFFTMLLTALVETIPQIAVGAVLVSGLYGGWLWLTASGPIGPGDWLRLPFFFIVAIFYAYMTEEVKRERARRRVAERQGEHLRFLLALGDAVTAPGTSAHWAQHVSETVEAAFPRLGCEVVSTLPPGPTGAVHWVPLKARGRTYGGLRVTPRDGSPLTAEEERFCALAALVAANGLFAAEEAADAVRVKQEFLWNLSHELRTPLHAILGYVELLERTLEVSGDGVVADSLQRLRVNSTRLHGLLEELLWFAELRCNGARTVARERLDLAQIFAELEPEVLASIDRKPVRFLWRIGPDVPVLHTDGRKVRQILTGLLSNAVKFTERGTIRLYARRVTPREVEIGVEDTGIGLRPGDYERIFEEFRQVDGSLVRRAGGLGLGLALVRELTLLLGGTIHVRSSPEGGSAFRVCLPIDVAPAGPADRPAAAGAPVPPARLVPATA